MDLSACGRSSTVASATSEVESQLSSGPTIERSSEATGPPSLSSLPREVRDIVLRELLTFDKTFDLVWDYRNWRENFPGLVLLHVNGQLREEAWDMIVKGNIWIELSAWPDADNGLEPDSTALDVFRPDGGGTPLYRQPIVDLDWFPRHEAERIRNAVAVNLQLGKKLDSAGLDPGRQRAADSLVFAFHPTTYGYLANFWAAQVRVWNTLTVRLNIQINPESQVWKINKIFSPLGIIRGARHIRIPACDTETLTKPNNLGNLPRVKAIMDSMERPLSSAGTVMEVLKWFIVEAEEMMQVRNYGDTVRILTQGRNAWQIYLAEAVEEIDRTQLDHIRYASPKHNSIMHLWAMLNINFAVATVNAIHQRIEIWRGRGCSGKVFHGHVSPHSLETAIDACCCALDFAGITDDHRFAAHLTRATAFRDMADYITELGDLSDAQRQHVLNITHFDWSNALECRLEAVSDLFYARNLANPDHPLAQWMANCQSRLCQIVPADVLRQRNIPGSLERYRIPLLGTWTSDPRLLQHWGVNHCLMMKLFQQRVDPAMGEVTDEDELRQAYATIGIRWMVVDYDQIYVIVKEKE